MDASKEVRNLLEFLYLDVKVRSPAEVSKERIQEPSLLNYMSTFACLDLRINRLEAGYWKNWTHHSTHCEVN